MENHDVPLNDISGPLTDRQIDVMNRISAGEEHASIARDYSVGRTTISQEPRRVVIKLGARNTFHAVAMLERARTLRAVADRLDAALTGADIDELTAALRAEATEILP